MVLAVHFRETNNGELVGVRCTILKMVLKHWHWLAYLFSALGVLTVFGTMQHVNTITAALDSALLIITLYLPIQLI
ncbi:MAG: hypothetical protein ACLS9K_09720 [Lachnospira eligens]